MTEKSYCAIGGTKPTLNRQGQWECGCETHTLQGPKKDSDGVKWNDLQREIADKRKDEMPVDNSD